MEDILDRIIAEAAQSKQPTVCESCYAAREILCDNSALLKNPVYEVREKCLVVVNKCLSLKNNKLATLSVIALQRLLRDQLYWTVDSDNEEQLLPLQFCATIDENICAQPENTQVDLLKVLLEMSCTGSAAMSTNAVEQVLLICLKVISTASAAQPVVSAAQATASQTAECFVKHLVTSGALASTKGFEDGLFPLVTSLAQKLNEKRKLAQIGGSAVEKSGPAQMCLLLNCIHSALVPIPDNEDVVNDSFLDFIWRTLCPLLIKLLGARETRTKVAASDFSHESALSQNFGRGSESLSADQVTLTEQKHVYAIGAQLVRLCAPVKSMRPVLESLFHRMVLFPHISLRIEPLKATREMLRSPELVVKIVSPPSERLGKTSKSNQLDLFRIFIDSLKECSYALDTSITHQSVLCITTLVITLEKISVGQGIDDRIAEAILTHSECKENANTEMLHQISQALPSDMSSDDEPPPKPSEPVQAMRKDFKNFAIDDYKSKLGDILHSFNKQPSEDIADTLSPVGDSNDGGDADVSSSTDTEGPEDDCDLDNEVESVEAGARLKKILEEESYLERRRIELLVDSHDEVARNERENARLFVKELRAVTPRLLRLKSAIEADDALQAFASNYCSSIWAKQFELVANAKCTEEVRDRLIIVNGDGIYLTTYMALLLNLRLLKDGFYSEQEQDPTLTEQEFVNEIQGSGLVIHLSQTWLAEVYQAILADDILSKSGYTQAEQNGPLINMLIDIDGLGDTQPGSQELTDYKKLSCGGGNTGHYSKEVEAGRKLVTQIMNSFWSSMLTTLGSLFRNENDCNTHGLLALLADSDHHKESDEKRQVLVTCLESLQVAARLCISLGLQNRCNGIFDLLTKSVCPTELDSSAPTTSRRISLRKKLSALPKSREQFSLHTSQVLSMKAILASALEIGSHCTPCWEFVFRCCEYIISMENNYFSQRSSALSKSKQGLRGLLKSKDAPGDLDLNFGKSSEMGSCSSIPGLDFGDEDVSKSLDACIDECSVDTAAKNVLRERRLETAIECLYQLVEKMFDDSASRLNLKSLIGFLAALSTCSAHELHQRRRNSSLNGITKAPLLFTRLCDLILRISRSGRPLLHFLRCWSEVVPRLLEAACDRSDIVSKTAVSTINDVITVVLSTHTEMEHFHFNESLFRPYETLLLLELCDADIQEMIISSVCGFVEGSAEDIRSGWRTLFGALRGIQLPGIPPGSSAADAYELEVERVRQLRVILDIFEAFLNTQNLQTFANAAVDCLLCLFRLLRDPTEDDSPSAQFVRSEWPVEKTSELAVDLCLLALKYLHQFESMLRSMYIMPACPLFSSTRRITVCSDPKVIERAEFCDETRFPFAIPCLLTDLDRPVRVLHVWFLLLDGLTNAIISCPKQHQAKAIEMSLALVGTLREVPSLEFAVHVINHITLPLLQRWIRELNVHFSLNAEYFKSVEPSQSTQFTNLKHFCGLVSHLVVEHTKLSVNNYDGNDPTSDRLLKAVDLMLSQALAVFIEPLSGNYHDVLYQVTTSCIRHVLTEVADHLRLSSWDIVCQSLTICNELCLRSLNQLIDSFPNKTVHFFEDLQKVKIVSRRDSTARETQRLVSLAQQLFLVDAQKSKDGLFKPSLTSEGDDRSFVFQVEATAEAEAVEISFRSLVYELNCHQLLIKTIAKLLLQGVQHRLPSLTNSVVDLTSCDDEQPLIKRMDGKHIEQLTSILDHSYDVMVKFDERPGLKFLLQKVSRLDVPANLYKQSALCYSTAVITHFQFVSNKSLDDSNYDNYCRLMTQQFFKACDKFSDFAAQTEKTTTRLDILSQEPFFVMACEVPFLEMIGLKSFELSRDIDTILGTKSAKDDKSPSKSASSKESVEPSPGNEDRAFTICTQEKISQMTEDYKKLKKHHAPFPPEITERFERKKSLPKRFAGDNCTPTEKANDACLVKDADVFRSLWSQTIAATLVLHLDLEEDAFRRLIPVFAPGFETLVTYVPEPQLRSPVSLWVKRVSAAATLTSEPDLSAN